MKNNLDFLMESNRVGVTKLAKEIKVSRGTIYRTLNGGTPSAGLMLKISKYFNRDVKDIFFDSSVQQIVHGRTSA
ncbi:hypothetical protein PAECIP111893_02433 [Paenibacillus plantiphilus]|uniref:HTH cro/C1-type domain-containing protein n=1 Tax=Paenibacillus plantiphilus TaxID=2905650 RepID=A0ABM9C736_9BACL|nr:helix-turn-helix domain-containing protein [Paenibacillus plantiphilus]CAH1205832.1 hypothetical protein PAECIP111893_02433 [Paenibacillus plantiphilus]